MMIVLVVVERNFFKVLFLLSFLGFRAEAYAEKSEFILPFSWIFYLKQLLIFKKDSDIVLKKQQVVQILLRE